jgi:hypothetical protein
MSSRNFIRWLDAQKMSMHAGSQQQQQQQGIGFDDETPEIDPEVLRPVLKPEDRMTSEHVLSWMGGQR